MCMANPCLHRCPLRLWSEVMANAGIGTFLAARSCVSRPPASLSENGTERNPRFPARAVTEAVVGPVSRFRMASCGRHASGPVRGRLPRSKPAGYRTPTDAAAKAASLLQGWSTDQPVHSQTVALGAKSSSDPRSTSASAGAATRRGQDQLSSTGRSRSMTGSPDIKPVKGLDVMDMLTTRNSPRSTRFSTARRARLGIRSHRLMPRRDLCRATVVLAVGRRRRGPDAPHNQRPSRNASSPSRGR